MTVVFGIDVGGTNIKAVAARPAGEILARYREPTPSDHSVKQTVVSCIKRLARETGEPDAIGIAVPGLVALDRLSLANLPRDDQDLVGVNWQQFLGFGRPIPMINDAQAALMGEAWLGAARGLDHVIMLTLGTGVGCAAICDGKLLRGQLGRAGTIAHTSLDAFGPQNAYGCPGAFENFVCNGSLRERTGGRFDSTVDLLRAADDGDQEAATVWERSMRALAAGINSAINVLDPQRVVLGGGMIQANERLLTPLRHWLEEFSWRPLPEYQVEIVFAELGDDAGPLGAIRLALDEARERIYEPS